MKLTKHIGLLALLALGLPLPANGQEENAAAPDDGAVANEDETAAAADAEAPAPSQGSEATAAAPDVEQADESAADADGAVAKPDPSAKPASAKVKARPPKVAPAEPESAAATGSGSEGSDDTQPQAPGKYGPYDFLSEGKRLDLKDGDLSIEPPVGWEVYTSQTGLSLFAQPPHDPKFKYQRTIQIAAFDGPRYMDEMTAKEFEEEIPRKFSAISNAIEGYKVRNHTPVEMGDSRQALLFYTEFKLDGVPLMQAHILVSSALHHYLLTYTDVATHFEDDAESQFLTEAWTALTSVQLKSHAPMRYESTMALGIGAAGFAAACFLIWFFRNWAAKRRYAYYGSGKGLDDVDVKSDSDIGDLKAEAPSTDAPGMSGLETFDDDEDKRA